MVRCLFLLVGGGVLAIAWATAAPAAFSGEPVRFATVQVYLDPQGVPLAAYQVQLTEAGGRMTVVGLENGEHEAFAEPPLYDRAALTAGRADRLILAAYSLLPADRLPTGRTRVATVHVQLRGDGAADFRATLVAAGDPMARPIQATLSIE